MLGHSSLAERRKPSVREGALATDAELARLLRAVQDGDDANALTDNGGLASALTWSLDDVATCLSEAKARSLIWGSRSGQRPAPWFTDLELTVQGRRFLAEHGSKLP
jgi:hypothetical protein